MNYACSVGSVLHIKPALMPSCQASFVRQQDAQCVCMSTCDSFYSFK